MQPHKLKKEARSEKREAGDAKFKHFLGLVLSNLQGTLRCKQSSFSSGNTAAVGGLYSRWYADGRSTPVHSISLRWFYGRKILKDLL